MSNTATPSPNKFILVIKALINWLIAAISTIICGTAVILSFPLPFRWRYSIKSLWIRINLLSLKHICGLDYKIEGAENIPKQPTLIFSKHQSTYETYVLENIFIPITWIIKRELLWVPFFGWGLALLGATPIDRKGGRQAVEQVIKQGTKSLQKGRWVIIFPEGTRKAPGSPLNYRLGGGHLAASSGYPILPIAHNAGEFWPRGSFIKWPGTVTVSIGPLIDTTNKTAEVIVQEVQDWIEAKMAQISDERRWQR